jgi:putative transposase
MKYQFIEEHKREFPIVVMCGVLAVSESGFYAWRKRPICRRKREDAHLKQEIRQVFEEHSERYGAPRIYRDLHDEGISCSRKRVARLMRAEELSARSKRRRVVTTKRDEIHAVAPNLLNRDFHAEEPDKK